jgi:murein DD-endopeptidase MepM/ murein hydrolase activator NlpD
VFLSEPNRIYNMRIWPVSHSYRRTPPVPGSPGSFWEDRGDRYHCGVDIYAPKGCQVLAVDDGVILDTGVFTSPEIIPYWNTTFYIVMKDSDGLIIKYAELEGILVERGEKITAGQLLGYVGQVLNREAIGISSPGYIQRLKTLSNLSMLHFEMYRTLPSVPDKYIGGNTALRNRPENLLDPGPFLKTCDISTD